jgi:ABC-type transporter Mla MlaB component
MKAMTDIPAAPPGIEVVLTGAVTVESLRPIERCLRQLVGGSSSYLIRAEDVTRIDSAAARMLHDFVAEVAARGAKVRWAAAGQNLIGL